MYRSDHIDKYRMLPMNILNAYAIPQQDIYSNFFIKSNDSDMIRCFTAHRHEAIELIYVQEGEIHADLEHRPLTVRAGDLMVVNPFIDHEAHYFIATDKMRYRCIQFELSSFMPPMNSMLHECMRHLLDGSGHIREHIPAEEPIMQKIIGAMDRLSELWDNDTASPGGDSMRISMIYELLSYLIANYYVDKPIEAKVNRDLHFIRLIVGYLNEHFTEELSTSIISEALCYNINHFCRAFRSNFGASFTRNLCEFRLMQAMNNYRDRKMMINEIAAAVGFRDYGYFAQAFKKYTGISPAVFFLGRSTTH